MFKRILTYSIIAVLGLALIGGTIAILVRPENVEAYGGRGGVNQDRQGSLNGNLESELRGSGNNQGQGRGQGQGDGTNGENQNSGSGGGGNGDRGQGNA
ncbi:MAG: hypothetical protein MIO92_09285, partial [Methanosarcinaceae archaeon]|nr:hypothetical protein [Methanosarcinaceae archaeon]